MNRLDELLAPVRLDPSTAGVIADFDGTLSPIVDDPAAARPADGAADALAGLARRYRTVAVVSGRPVSFLRAVLPETVELVGLYGLERLRHGQTVDHPDALLWRPAIERATSAALAELPADVLVEPKGLTVTLHYRTAPRCEQVVERWAATRAAVDGLVVHRGKMSVELHPPLAVNKGTAVRALAEGLRAVCFIGDDVGDLPAFDVLDDLRAGGVVTAAIAVRSAEAPPEVLAAADLVVDGPAGAVEVLLTL